MHRNTPAGTEAPRDAAGAALMRERALSWIAAQDTPELYLCLSETLKLGRGEVAWLEHDGLLVRILRNGAYLAAPLTVRAARAMRELVGRPPIIGLVDARFAEHISPGERHSSYTLWHYPHAEPVPAHVTTPASGGDTLELRLLDASYAQAVAEQYKTMPAADTVEHVEAGLVYGGFDRAGNLAGFIGEHDESSMGMLEVYPAFRKHGYATQLEAAQIARFLGAGRHPFCQVAVGNEASEALQRKLGLAQVPGEQCWISY